jgi:putative tricarboxylic transport membrane protein
MSEDKGGGTIRSPSRLANWNANTIVALMAVAFALFLFWIIPSEVSRPPPLFGISISDLDPAIFPIIVASGLLLIGGLYFVASLGMPARNGFTELDLTAWLNLAVTIGLFILYGVLLIPLGFILSSAIILFALALFYGARHPIGLAITCLGIPTALYLIFTKFLLVSLPGLPEFSG